MGAGYRRGVSVLLFDLFGVIARTQSPASLAEIEGLGEAPAAEFWAAYWELRQPYDRGEETGPEYFQTVGRRLGRTYQPRRLGELVDADVRSWSAVDDQMVDFVRRLAAGGHRLGLLSNIPLEHADDFERRQPWLEVFEVRAFSCRIRHAKPEPGAYTWCLHALGVAAEEVLFIDDREPNVAAARSLGLRGHLFTSLSCLREVARSATEDIGGATGR